MFLAYSETFLFDFQHYKTVVYSRLFAFRGYIAVHVHFGLVFPVSLASYALLPPHKQRTVLGCLAWTLPKSDFNR